MALSIRPAALSDVPKILAIERQSPTAAHWTAEQYIKLVSSDRGAGDVLVAENEGELCGFICAQVIADEWEIENVVVAGEFLRRGIADQLMGALIQRARNESASAILLEVRESNRPAQALYGKHGFREEGCRRRYYDSPAEDAMLYALRFER
jgi:ribosomal-protein-alanine N-acetyltransferase